MVWPFMWPKKSVILQFDVICCIGLLVVGRVVNLFTPILYKDIGEQQSQGGVEWGFFFFHHTFSAVQ